MIQFIRYLLFPFALLYAFITRMRMLFYDKGWFKTYKIPCKSIVVGNLTVGGTGKTPHVEYLVHFLNKTFDTSILSRGYGRKTKGYIQANAQSTPNEIGDEPTQYVSKFFPETNVVVCEKRAIGVQKILEYTATKKPLIILDDAFQHRAVQAGIYLLLTDYKRLFTNDWMLPLALPKDSVMSGKSS